MTYIIKATHYPSRDVFDVMVDPCTFLWASRYSWFMNRDGYVFRNRTIYHKGWKRRTKTYRQYLHREVMGLRRRHKRVVHHWNSNPIDCRRSNMHIMTAARNTRLARRETTVPQWASTNLW